MRRILHKQRIIPQKVGFNQTNYFFLTITAAKPPLVAGGGQAEQEGRNAFVGQGKPLRTTRCKSGISHRKSATYFY